MYWKENKVEDVKIAYIGGGSRGWAWGLMSDLAAAEDMSGTVMLYDIDKEAAHKNEVIGNKMKEAKGSRALWRYKMADTLKEALNGADFVVISIMPGTFDEMESDVHTPEKYGIYQSVGDTSGPGGIVRGMRCIPMFEEFALAIKENCPDAWVINYTNPMTLCVKALYRIFPEIKAFGCCHEVFGTQKLLLSVLEEQAGITEARREEIQINVLGVNHFTWITQAKYRNLDLFPLYREFALKHREEGIKRETDDNWMNKNFKCGEKVKFDLFFRYGYIAAAGDRHLAEFCPGQWYLQNPEMIEKWGFTITPVSWRKEELKLRLARSERLFTGEEKFELKNTGEEGVEQIRALLGLRELVTNVNIPNVGQIPNLPLGAIVETNAHFSAGGVKPVMAGEIPESIYPLISRVCGEQEMVSAGIAERNIEKIFAAFCQDANMNLPVKEAGALFKEMVQNTKKYLFMYDLTKLDSLCYLM